MPVRFPVLVALIALPAVAAPQGCVGSISVTSLRLSAAPTNGSSAQWLAVRHINNLPSGYHIRYQPQDLPADLKKDAKLTVVLVSKTSDQITVLEPRAAAMATEWQIPFAVRMMLLVFAPQGLDEKRLTNLVTRDDNLVSALADYADQTADLEAGMQALSDLDDDLDSDTKPLRATTPTEQALFALVRALNPAVSSYNPLGAGRLAGPASTMGKGADAFFQNAGGFVPGGGILPGVKNWLMPDTEFRAVYGVANDSEGMTLCAQTQARSRNKMAYLWAYRLTGATAPAAAILKEGDVPMGLRARVPLKLDKAADWRLLSRVFDWALIAESGSVPALHVTGHPIAEERVLQLDLRKFPGGPGAYRLEGKWDWSAFHPTGTVQLHLLDDLKTAAPTPESQDQLIAGTGPASLDLRGADFLFVDRAWLHRPGSTREIPVDLPPERAGPSDQLRVGLDTDGLRPGPYALALSRIDGAVADIAIRLLPAPPKLDGPAPRVNLGEKEQTVMFTGTGLDRVERIDSDRADITLKTANQDGTRREGAVRLRSGVVAGEKVALLVKAQGMSQPLRFPGALQVLPARPRIREARASLPPDLTVALREGEIPSGSWVSFSLRVEPADARSVVTLECAEPARTVQRERLIAGEKHPNAQLASAGDGGLFLALDPGTVGQSGCGLTVTIETEELGKSDAFPLGKVVRFPRIESFSLTDERSKEGFYGLLRGFELETIEKTGWNPIAGLATAELPRPVAGEGARQSLRIAVPWPSPSPKAPLFIWLRGETEGRATKVTP